MKWFDHITVNAFRHDADGRTLFCRRLPGTWPWLPSQRYYVVPRGREAEWIRFVRWYYSGLFVAFAVAVPALGFLRGPLLVCIVGYGIFAWRSRSFARALVQADTRPVESRRDLVNRKVLAVGRTRLRIANILAIAALAGSIALLVFELIFPGLVALLISGVALWLSVKRLRRYRELVS